MSPLHLIVYAVLALAGGYCALLGGYYLLASGGMFSLGVAARDWRSVGMMLLTLAGGTAFLVVAFLLGSTLL